MKHTVYIYKEHYGCNAQPVLYPFMAYESTMWFCRKISRNNMACVVEIKTNRLYHSLHHIEKLMGL